MQYTHRGMWMEVQGSCSWRGGGSAHEWTFINKPTTKQHSAYEKRTQPHILASRSIYWDRKDIGIEGRPIPGSKTEPPYSMQSAPASAWPQTTCYFLRYSSNANVTTFCTMLPAPWRGRQSQQCAATKQLDAPCLRKNARTKARRSFCTRGCTKVSKQFTGLTPIWGTYNIWYGANPLRILEATHVYPSWYWVYEAKNLLCYTI